MSKTVKSNIYLVARGGKGAGRNSSYTYGERVLEILKKKDFEARDLYLHPNGMWTLDGLLTNVEEVVPQSKFVYITFVGSDGELGDLQELCEKHGVSHSGLGSFYSRLVSDKSNFKKIAKQHGIKSPYAYFVPKNSKHTEAAREVFSKIEIPIIIKANSGSGVEEVYVATKYGEIEQLMEKMLNDNKDILAEKLLRGADVKVLVKPYKDSIHTCVAVDSNMPLTHTQLIEVRDQALLLHSKLGFDKVVEYDYILNKDGAHFLEANSHPDILHPRYNEFWQSLPHTFEEYIISLIP